VFGGGVVVGVFVVVGYIVMFVYVDECYCGYGWLCIVCIIVMGIIDLYGSVLNWDYFKDVEYDDSKYEDIGLVKILIFVRVVC